MIESGMKSALDHYGYFTNEALLNRLEKELAEERSRIEKRRDEDRKVDHDRLERIERDIHDMRNLIFAAFQRKNGG